MRYTRGENTVNRIEEAERMVSKRLNAKNCRFTGPLKRGAGRVEERNRNKHFSTQQYFHYDERSCKKKKRTSQSCERLAEGRFIV